jgi:hypothetical protein
LFEHGYSLKCCRCLIDRSGEPRSVVPKYLPRLGWCS